MPKTLADKLASVVPASAARVGSIVESEPDLQRILKLPRRSPVICEVDPVTKRYPAATQALIEVETEKFSRGQRISCACRPRKVVLGHDDVLTIFRVLPEGVVPEAPIIVPRAVFLADNRTMGDESTARTVTEMQPGQEVCLPAADGEIGHPCITTLAPAQAWFLREAALCGGVVGFMGVGSGKSIAFLLAPLLFPDGRLAVLLIEPKQRQHYRSQYLRLREHFRVSSIVCDAEVPGGTVAGTVPLHLVSYSVLSRTANSDLLDRLKPDIVLLDEAHRACGVSAINRRIKRYVTARIKEREDAMARGERVRARAVRLLDGSGTLESKSVNDTQMLCAYSLGTGSPLPLDPNEAEAWSNVMDVSYQPDRKSATSRMLHSAFGRRQLPTQESVDLWLDDEPEQELRKGFQKWRAHTPGIITATASDINASLSLTEFEVPKMPKVVSEALSRVRVDWLRPDGEEFIEKVEQLACAKNVACGFFPYWAFPKHACTCTTFERCDQCLLIEEWYLRRKKKSKEFRQKLLLGEVHLDSPKLCEEAAERGLHNAAFELETYCDTCFHSRKMVPWPCVEPGHLPAWNSTTWKLWHEIEDRVEYEERVKWIGHDLPEAQNPATHPGYYLARAVAEWALKNKGVIWFQSVPLGRKIAELSGLPYFNGGPGGEERLRAEKGNRSVICSISAHGAGTDGLQQLFDQQVVVEVPPSNASTHGWEQIFGRLHRRGQQSDNVHTLACLHVSEFRDALRKALQQAEFNRNMTGNVQKLLLADIDIDEL